MATQGWLPRRRKEEEGGPEGEAWAPRLPEPGRGSVSGFCPAFPGDGGGPRREGLGEPEAPGEGGTSARSPGSSHETPTPRWWPRDPGSPTALLPTPPPAQWPQGGSCPPGEPPLAPRPTCTGSAQAAPPPGKSRPSPFTPAAPHNVGDTFSSSRDPCPSSLTPTEAARLAQGDLGPMWRVQPGPGQTPAILPAPHSVTVFSPGCSAVGSTARPQSWTQLPAPSSLKAKRGRTPRTGCSLRELATHEGQRGPSGTGRAGGPPPPQAGSKAGQWGPRTRALEMGLGGGVRGRETGFRIFHDCPADQ